VAVSLSNVSIVSQEHSHGSLVAKVGGHVQRGEASLVSCIGIAALLHALLEHVDMVIERSCEDVARALVRMLCLPVRSTKHTLRFVAAKALAFVGW